MSGDIRDISKDVEASPNTSVCTCLGEEYDAGARLATIVDVPAVSGLISVEASPFWSVNTEQLDALAHALNDAAGVALKAIVAPGTTLPSEPRTCTVNGTGASSPIEVDKVYVQSFVRAGKDWQPATELAIRRFVDWLAAREPSAWVTGPGLLKWAPHLLPETPKVDAPLWEAQPASLLHLGLARYRAGERDDPWTLEPLYLRPSSAEEQWRGRSP